ncbi:LytR C-terminal domain-containing protein [Micrococcales bacterium 31B]|nr:LytR C-terminal domain-containing protein [Micrococcales bacterium 31B]
MAIETTEYAPDEFDLKAAEAQHRGVHRAKVTPWQSVRPYFFVFAGAVLVVAAAYMFIRLNDQAVKPEAAGNPAASAGAAAPGTSTDAAPEPVPQQTVVAPDPNVAVIVSNAGTVSGMAGKVQSALVESGWSVPIINSTPVEGVTSSAVLYSDEQFKAQAEAVAVRLGIDTVELNTSIGDAINVQILTEYGDTVPPESTTVVTQGAEPAGATATSAASDTQPDPSVAVAVVNGNGKAGLASTIVGGLQAYGWASAFSNGNTDPTPNTVVYYPDASQEAVAKSIAQTVSASATVSLDASRAQITVVVGTDFEG